MLPLIIFGALAGAASAALRDAPDLSPEQVLRELETIEKARQQELERFHRAAIEKLRTGFASPGAASSLYAEAVENTRFVGRPDKVPAFLEWKKNNAELLRSPEFAKAAQFHLRYLILSLERAASEKEEEYAAPSLAYATELANFLLALDKSGRQPGELRELLDKPCADGVFSKWQQLGPRLPRVESWEPAAGNLAGILKKNVRSPLRKAADSRLLEAYDLQLNFEAERVTGKRLEHEAQEYNTVRRPRLQFQRAEDLVVLGLKNRGIQEMMLLVRTYPYHPDFSKWMARLRELVAPQPTQNLAEPGPEAQ